VATTEEYIRETTVFFKETNMVISEEQIIVGNIMVSEH